MSSKTRVSSAAVRLGREREVVGRVAVETIEAQRVARRPEISVGVIENLVNEPRVDRCGSRSAGQDEARKGDRKGPDDVAHSFSNRTGDRGVQVDWVEWCAAVGCVEAAGEKFAGEGMGPRSSFNAIQTLGIAGKKRRIPDA